MRIKHKQYLWLGLNQEDAWFSSHHLVQNLKLSYREKFGPSFHELDLPMEGHELSSFIQKNQITTVILADPRLNLHTLLRALPQNHPALEFLIHVIGSPLRKLEDLKNINLSDLKICLLAGSRANVNILKNLCEGEIRYFPFLPDLQRFLPGTLKPLQNKFVYLGRISHYKNVTALMELFSRYQKECNPEAELSIYGSPCNANFPVRPQGHYIGMSGEQFFWKLAELQARGHRITYHPSLERDELLKTLPQFNTLLSLSTAEEEDFGMSVIECLAHGLGCVLTNWGGYKEFSALEQVSLVNVAHQDGTLWIDPKEFFHALDRQNQKTPVDLKSWLEQRKKVIADLDLSFSFGELVIRKKQPFVREEFFNEYQEFVSPYWDSPSEA